MQKSIGYEPKQLADRPRLRDELLPYWSLFVELKNATDGAIMYTHIAAYASLCGSLSGFEIDAIRALDVLHAKVASD